MSNLIDENKKLSLKLQIVTLYYENSSLEVKDLKNQLTSTQNQLTYTKNQLKLRTNNLVEFQKEKVENLYNEFKDIKIDNTTTNLEHSSMCFKRLSLNKALHELKVILEIFDDEIKIKEIKDLIKNIESEIKN